MTAYESAAVHTALFVVSAFTGYRMIRLLGSGWMGEVYLAEHPRLPCRDALKVRHRPVDCSITVSLRTEIGEDAVAFDVREERPGSSA